MIVAVPPARVLGVIEEAGEVGVSAAIVATAGMGYGADSLGDQVRLAARAHGLRIVGPNCIGVLAPRAKMNASFAAHSAKPGDLALVSQSGAVAAGLVEWAAQRHVGFSAIVSLGDKVDVDFSDCLDFFAADAGTRAILLYIESIDNAQKFMSAARAAARVKPVVVIKAGRHAQGREGRRHPYGRAGGFRCGLRRRLPPRRPAARARSRPALRRRGDARPAEAVSWAAGWQFLPMAAASGFSPSTG